MEFTSLNKETGMLEDIDEVRRIGLALAGIAKALMDAPITQLSMPMSLRIDTAYMIAGYESMLKKMSQAESLREFASIIGDAMPGLAEEVIQENGLSNIFPVTSPDAPPVHDADLPMNNPVIQNSIVFGPRSLYRAEKKEPEPPPTTLPDSLEAFLKAVQDLEDKPEKE